MRRPHSNRPAILLLAGAIGMLLATGVASVRLATASISSTLLMIATFIAIGVLHLPLLWVVAAVMVGERVVAFSLSSPAIKVMYTLAAPDEKYKVQSFVDTVVYRGGDAAAGWVFALIGGSLGFAAAAVPLVALPLAALWLWNAKELGGAHGKRAEDAAKLA